MEFAEGCCAMTAREIEIAVAHHFNSRQNVIVPNVSWGLGLSYEADLVVLRPSGYAVEVEIKVSAADIRADLKKTHEHRCKWFRELWFAVPQDLADCEHIPAHAGILAVKDNGLATWKSKQYCEALRRCLTNKQALKWGTDKRMKLMSLGCMRIWTLKAGLARLESRGGKRCR